MSRNDIEMTHRIGHRHHIGSAEGQRPRQIIVKFGNHRIQEDLTPTIYERLQDLKKCEKVQKCCSIDGKIKSKLNGDSTVHTIPDGLHFYNVIHG